MRGTVAALAACCALVLAACAAETPVLDPLPPSVTATPVAASPSPTPTPTPTEISVKAARLAAYASGDALYVYDVERDVVEQVARGVGVRAPRFLSATEVSFVQGNGAADFLRVLDLRSRELREIFSVPTGIRVYGWSPDRQTVAYVTSDDRAYPHLRYRSLQGSTRSVATLARALGRGGVPDDQERVEFSPDGRHVLVVYTPADGDGVSRAGRAATQLQVRALDGTLVHGPALAGDPTMGFWSRDGARVYYRHKDRARSWSVDDRRVRPVPGVPRWFDPWPSPDGASVAYDTGLTGGGVRVRILDLRTGGGRALTDRGRAHPVWAAKGTVWVQAARACEACPAGAEVLPDVYAVRVKDGRQRRIALPTLFDLDAWYA